MAKVNTFSKSLIAMGLLSLVTACGGSSGGNDIVDGGQTAPTTPTTPTTPSTPTDDTCENPVSTLPPIFLEYNASPNVTAVLSESGCFVTIESNGKPDHTSSYWDAGNASGLYVEPEDPALFEQQRSPGDIEDYINVYQLTVPIEAQLAATSSSTPLGAIGIAISGAPIFNDSEGNGDVSLGVIQGFDRNGAHTGPETYHYHLEPRAISYDDDKLVGIMSDGFFIYGRRDYETGEYPTDLDESNGHVGLTPHTGTSPEDAVYHYHISSEQYLNGDYYLIFPGNFQGTPNGVN